LAKSYAAVEQPVVSHDEYHGPVAHQFDTLEQQHEADRIGMWTFLATEVLFFSALFCVYAVYRWMFPEGWASGASHLNVPLGTFNTAVLLCSSLSVAFAVRAAEMGNKRMLILMLVLTMIFGLAFLGVKAYEYYYDYEEGLIPGLRWTYFEEHGEHFEGEARQVQLFFVLYFTMTGIHALHMIIGLGVFATLLVMAIRDKFSNGYFMPVELTGLYWHFVDIVWVFLFPMMYLI
jgi:cytochrome c oxidase subunit III